MPAVHAITLLSGKLTGFSPLNALPTGVFDNGYLTGFYHHAVDIFSDPTSSIKAVITNDKPDLLL
jgi:hypothetical protein